MAFLEQALGNKTYGIASEGRERRESSGSMRLGRQRVPTSCPMCRRRLLGPRRTRRALTHALECLLRPQTGHMAGLLLELRRSNHPSRLEHPRLRSLELSAPQETGGQPAHHHLAMVPAAAAPVPSLLLLTAETALLLLRSPNTAAPAVSQAPTRPVRATFLIRPPHPHKPRKTRQFSARLWLETPRPPRLRRQARASQRLRRRNKLRRPRDTRTGDSDTAAIRTPSLGHSMRNLAG